MHTFNLRKTLLASLLSAALVPSAFAQTFSNTNDTAYFWGLDDSGNPQQITGVSAVPFQGNPYTIMYADDNQGVPLNTSNPGPDTANVVVYDGGLATSDTGSTYVKINGGQNNLTVSGAGVTVNGQAVATDASVAAAVSAIDLTPYAQLSGAAFTGAVSAAGISAGNAGISNAGAISGVTSLTASGAVAVGSLSSAGALNVTGRSTLSGGLSAGGAGISDAGAITGATTIAASGLISAGRLSSAGALDVNGLATLNAGATITGATAINATGTAATQVGNTDVASATTVRGGNAAMSVANNAASLSVVNGGFVAMDASSATMRGTGTLAANGAMGVSSASGAGAVTIYNTAQTIAAGSTINNALEGRTYQNKLNGNTFVDGNVYINGTLAYVSSDSATTTVVGNGANTSKLANATRGTAGGTSIVMKGSEGATESVASLTLTNGLGNRHGVEVYEDRSVFSGGTQSTTMTLDDNGASFRNVQSGGPARVTGVADGASDFDAVNYRQLRNVNRAISSLSAMSNIPQVDPGKTFAMGAGIGSYNGEASIALGGSYRISANTVVKASLGTSKGNKATTVFGAGASTSW